MIKALDARVRLIATAVQVAVPALALGGYFSFLRLSRPHVTDIEAGFIMPYRSGGVTRYFAQQDWTIIHGLEAWLGVAILVGLVCYWRVARGVAIRMARSSRPARAQASADNTTVPTH